AKITPITEPCSYQPLISVSRIIDPSRESIKPAIVPFSIPARSRISTLTSKNVFPERSARFLSSASAWWKWLSPRNDAGFNLKTRSRGGLEFFRIGIIDIVGFIFLRPLIHVRGLTSKSERHLYRTIHVGSNDRLRRFTLFICSPSGVYTAEV